MDEQELECMKVLAECSSPDGEMCLNFKYIGELSGQDRATVRTAVRSLSDQGFAEYHRGLFTEDGISAGSGYCATTAGLDHLEHLDNCPPSSTKDGK